jgi:entericidin B
MAAELKTAFAACSDCRSIFHGEGFPMIRKIFVLILAATFLVGVAPVITGCSTIEGAGKDIEQGGKAIKDEAREQKNKKD